MKKNLFWMRVVKFLLLNSLIVINTTAQTLDYSGYEVAYIGDSLMYEGEYQSALNHFDAALKTDIHSKAEVYYKKAYMHHLLDQDSLKLVSFQRALDMNYSFFNVGYMKQDKLLKSITEDTLNTIYKQALFNTRSKEKSDVFCEYPSLRDSIIEFNKRDQKFRRVGLKNDSLWSIQLQYDSLDQQFIESMINDLGMMPGYKEIGVRATRLMMIMVAHSSDINFQSKVLKLAKIKMSEGYIASTDYALLYDKWQLKTIGYQTFGTQVDLNKELKIIESRPLLFPEYTDHLRNMFYLSSLKQYVDDMKKYNGF